MQNLATPIIYIVDDDDEVTASLRWLIEAKNYKVETHNSVESYLSHFNIKQRGCLILDIRLPNKSGFELQDTLNQMGATIPIIFITGHADIPMAVRGIKNGALDFLTKPFSNDLLLLYIERAISRNN